MKGALRSLWLAGPLLLAGCLASCWMRSAGVELQRARVTVAGHTIQVEVAESPAARMRGLSGRPALAADHGMLFTYDVASVPAFWMKDMRFDLDLVWIRGGRVVDLTARAPHRVEGPLPVYRPSEPVDLVLEVPAGTAARFGWRPGDAVEVVPPWPDPTGGAP
jgi:uncharacterized membrane protein (UPF0127 family)